MLAELEGRVQLAAAAGALAVAYLLYRVTQSTSRLPPGPRPLPIVGNLLMFRDSGPMFSVLTEMSQKYGDIMTLYFGPRIMVVLNSVESVREAFLKKGVEFADRPSTMTMKIVGEYSMLSSNHTPEWKVQRKIAHAALRKYATGLPLERLLQDKFAEFCSMLEKQGDTPFDPYEKITLLVYNVIGSMVLGRTFEKDDTFFANFIKNVDDLNEQFGNGLLADIYPILEYFPSRLVKMMKQGLAEFESLLGDTWTEHVANYNPDELTDFVYYLLAEKEEMEKEEDASISLKREHYTQLLSDMFFAGTDTSRMTLNWVVGLCVQHPEVQAKIHAEIDDVVGRDQPISLKHRPRLSYTEAVLHEAMRIYPVAPIGVPRATACDVELRDFLLPKGTWVVPNIWALHHNPQEWADPEEFKPERHLDDNGTLAPKPNSFLPFSTGRRVCVGESVAKSELHLLTAMLFQKLSFHPPPGEDFKLEMIGGLGCIAKSFKVVAKFRQ